MSQSEFLAEVEGRLKEGGNDAMENYESDMARLLRIVKRLRKEIEDLAGDYEYRTCHGEIMAALEYDGQEEGS